MGVALINYLHLVIRNLVKSQSVKNQRVVYKTSIQKPYMYSVQNSYNTKNVTYLAHGPKHSLVYSGCISLLHYVSRLQGSFYEYQSE